MMGLVSSKNSSSSSSPIVSLEEALLLPPDLNVYKDEIEGYLIDVSFTTFYIVILIELMIISFFAPGAYFFHCLFIVTFILFFFHDFSEI